MEKAHHSGYELSRVGDDVGHTYSSCDRSQFDFLSEACALRDHKDRMVFRVPQGRDEVGVMRFVDGFLSVVVVGATCLFVWFQAMAVRPRMMHMMLSCYS